MGVVEAGHPYEDPEDYIEEENYDNPEDLMQHEEFIEDETYDNSDIITEGSEVKQIIRH